MQVNQQMMTYQGMQIPRPVLNVDLQPYCYMFITRGTNCPRPERELMV